MCRTPAPARPSAACRAPNAGSLSQTALALVVIVLFVVTGKDPVLALFTWLTQLGTLSILSLMSLASFLAFLRRPELDRNVLRTRVAPVVGGIAMAAVAVYATSQFGLLMATRRARSHGPCPA